MTNQERAKAAVALFPKIESALYGENRLTNGEVASIVNAMGLLCPIAAGTYVIVPIEPTGGMISVAESLATMASWPKPLITYRAMLAASQEGEVKSKLLIS